MRKKNFSLISLGCFRNAYDSQAVIDRFVKAGFSYKGKLGCLDTLIINTCGFIGPAKEESIDVISRAVGLKKEGKIKRLLVFGCLVQRYRHSLEKEFPEVDRFWGIEDFTQKFTAREKKFRTGTNSCSRLIPSHIGFLKICEGCFNRCSYCAIPAIKGGLVSRAKEDIIAEAKAQDKAGVKELNIIGQDITSWGFDSSGDLPGLIRSILKAAKNIPWIRLIYTHPRHISGELIELIAKEGRLCKYIDLPIQHINNRVLKLMNRRTTKKQITALIKRIRSKIPGCAIRTSLIVGFPSESEEEFKELLSFVKETKFDRLGAFIYSREEQTPAYNFRGQIHPSTKRRRFKELMSLQKGIAAEANRKFIGRKLDILIESRGGGIFIGRSQYDAYQVDGQVFIKNSKCLKEGRFYRAKITDAYEYDLVGA